MYAHLPRQGTHPRRGSATGWRAPAPARRGPGRGHLRTAGIRRHRPGRLRDDRGTGTGRKRDHPRAGPGDHHPGGRRGRHGRLADLPDRARRCPARRRRSRTPGQGPGRPPGRLRTDRLTRPPQAPPRPRARIPARISGTGLADQADRDAAAQAHHGGQAPGARVRARAMEEAWLRHGIEEMAHFENFLPQLYQREATN